MSSRAMFTGVSGLNAHQVKLDVIANNIANVNTAGYRSSRAMFQDLLSQTIQGSRAPLESFGGTNPTQVGLGVRLGSIDSSFTQGPFTTTGISTDLAIQDGGFFILRDVEGGLSYTRDGSFAINANGQFIEPATGQVVQGFLADETGTIDTLAPIQDLEIPIGGTSIVRATTQADFQGNLESELDPGTAITRTVRVYDSLGASRDIDLTITKSANPNEWDWEVSTTDPAVLSVVGSGTITFDSDGRVSAGGTGNITVNFDPANSSAPADPFDFVFDFTEVSQLSAESDFTLVNQDGFPRGVLESFEVAQNGVINGVFTNGLVRPLGQVALATFSNNGGLERIGDNQFRQGPASGEPQIGVPDTGGRGTITGGTLENSNVDLGAEFSNLILTQRGFQANARTITAADTLLQETVNLIR